MKLNPNIIIKNINFPVELCITAEEQARGLMFKQGEVNLTAFPSLKSKIRKFWMKNTFIPLDIIFANDNIIIDICQGIPHDLTLVGPYFPSNLVVEAPLGFCKKHNLEIGNSIDLKYSISDLKKEYSLFLK